LLPRGILREPIKHLRRAHYVFLTKSDGRRDPELERVISTHNPAADIIECAHRPRHLRRFGLPEEAPGGREPLTFLQGRRVFAFSGIATPESFERFLDHYRFGEEDLGQLFAQAARDGAECLITTEKDAVRIRDDLPCPLPLYYLRLEIEILRGASDFDEAVGRICFPASGPRPAGR
jgi:tetraacyldisaccharide 4'-kinase